MCTAGNAPLLKPGILHCFLGLDGFRVQGLTDLGFRVFSENHVSLTLPLLLFVACQAPCRIHGLGFPSELKAPSQQYSPWGRDFGGFSDSPISFTEIENEKPLIQEGGSWRSIQLRGSMASNSPCVAGLAIPFSNPQTLKVMQSLTLNPTVNPMIRRVPGKGREIQKATHH